MLRAGTIIAGVGVTAVSTFAPSVGLSTDAQRAGFVIGVVLIVLGCVMYALHHKKETRPMSGSKSHTITSHNQSGGITAHTVNVGAPKAVVNGAVTKVNEQGEHGFVTELRIDIEKSYAAKQLMVLAAGSSIDGISAMIPGAGMMALNEYTNTDQAARIDVLAPLADQYFIRVLTKEHDDVKFNVEIN